MGQEALDGPVSPPRLPGRYKQHWHVGVRAKQSGKLVAFITGIPAVRAGPPERQRATGSATWESHRFCRILHIASLAFVLLEFCLDPAVSRRDCALADDECAQDAERDGGDQLPLRPQEAAPAPARPRTLRRNSGTHSKDMDSRVCDSYNDHEHAFE